MGENGKITKEAVGYILCNCLVKIIDLFVSTFLVAYLLSVSNGNIFNIGIFYIFNYISLVIFYWLFSSLLHKGNKVYYYRFSILLKFIFLLTIVLLKENVVNYIIPIALFYGLSSGSYWSAYNAMLNEAISSKSMHKFYGIYNIWGYIISIVAPIALGSVIEVGSFTKTAIYVVIICLLLLISTFLLVDRREDGNKINFKGFINEIKESKQQSIFFQSYLMCFFAGLKASIATIITIMIVLTFSSNISLGSLSSIMSLVSILVTFIFMKKYDSKKSKIISLCILLCAVGVLPLLFTINKTTIVLFNVLYTIAMIVPENLRSQRRMGIIRVTKKLRYTLEHNVISEIFLNMGRIVSYVILLIASFNNSMTVYKVLLAISFAFIFLDSISVYLMEKKYRTLLFNNDTLKHLKEVEEDVINYYHYKGELKKELTR